MRIVVPRTLSRCWLGLSRHIQLADTFCPSDVDLASPPLLPILILVLCLAPHKPSLPSRRRLDLAPKPKGFPWHDREATRMRSLPPGNLPE